MKKTIKIMMIMLATLATACAPVEGDKESVSGSSQTCSNDETVSNRDTCSHDETVSNRVVELCGKEGVTRGEDKDNVEVINYLTSNTDHIPMLYLYAVDISECKEENIIFSFDNDTEIVLADPLEKKLLDEQNYIIPDYMKYANSEGTNSCNKGDCLAWTDMYDRMAYMVIDGYTLTSLWSYNADKKEVSLIWYDKQNTSWENYTKKSAN